MKIYILIPVYNEELNLKELFSNLTKVLPEYSKHYVFVDDKSSDNSVAMIQHLFQNETYHLITKDVNIGPGDSFNQGFKWIFNHSTDPDDLIVTMEADNTSDIKLLHNMICISQLGYDLVLASPYAQGGGFDKTSFFRRILSHLANGFFRYMFKVKVLTLSSFYRVYKISLIEKIIEKYGEPIEENGFICMLEILLKSIKSYASIIEVPMVLFSEKRNDKSKMKVLKTSIRYLKFLIFKRF